MRRRAIIAVQAVALVLVIVIAIRGYTLAPGATLAQVGTTGVAALTNTSYTPVTYYESTDTAV